MIKVVFPGQSLSELAERFRGEARESFALILAQPAATSRNNWRLLVSSIHEPAEDEYEVRSETFVRPSATFRLKLEKQARLSGCSLIYCHSHPGAPGVPAFSPTDDTAEVALAVYAQERVKGVPHLALLIGSHGVRARELGSNQTAEVWEVGRRVTRQFPPNDASIATVHDRQIRAFGPDGQRAIHGLTIAIVGLGGTGSVVAQQLAHLGVLKFLLIDPDDLDDTSLNRVVGATKSDVGRPKVAIAKRSITLINPNATVQTIKRDILEAKVGARLREADFMFCCTDSHGSRHFLNQLAYQYFIPCIDMGVVINVTDGRLTHFDGRVKMLAPTMSCLVCQAGILSPKQVRWDLANERECKADPYFSEFADIKQPSVISLNSAMASLAMTMLLAVVAGVPTNARYQIYRGIPGVVRVLDDTPRKDCVNCSEDYYYGKGGLYELPARKA